jgi:hypothetical protein
MSSEIFQKSMRNKFANPLPSVIQMLRPGYEIYTNADAGAGNTQMLMPGQNIHNC